MPILLTLGLLLTTGFAALAVGTLNLVSVAFAVLFIGIAVDCAIQLSVRYREAQLQAAGQRVEAALAATARRAGPQVLVAACATAAGFLAFTLHILTASSRAFRGKPAGASDRSQPPSTSSQRF